MVVTESGELGAGELQRVEPGPESGIQLVTHRVPEFAELYRTHFAYVWKSARRLGVGPADLDDVVQETFLTVHRLLATYESRGSEQGWLFSVLFRVVQRHRRTHARKHQVNVEDAQLESMPALAGAPDQRAEQNESVRLLETILDALDADQRAVIVLADLEEMPVAEIAELLGINVNTTASRLRAARAHVEAAMARHRARDGWRTR